MPATLQLIELSLSYPAQNHAAVHGINLEIQPGEILSVIGPSGSGKSSLLRLIAGLSRPSSGRIVLGETCLADAEHCLPPERRPIGLVSQSGDLFPHLTVSKNIGYGLHRLPRDERRRRIAELLAAIELPDLGKRYPAELSGGECQRVALARALAPKPEVLLLDEPFSSADPELRERLRTLTLALLRESGTTALFVSHHHEDAHTAGDRVARLEKGRIAELSAPLA